MAIYTLQIKTVSRADKHSVVAKVAYTTRSIIKDDRTGIIYNYANKKMSEDLLFSEIRANKNNINSTYRSKIWNAAEATERRSNSRVGREYVIALPKEFTLEQNITLTREFVDYLTRKYNTVADFAIHDGKRDNGNVHSHIVTSTRIFNSINFTFGAKTDLELDNGRLIKEGKKITQEQINDIRKEWEIIQNRHLQTVGINQKVSSAKKENRDEVKIHLGKRDTALERIGIKTNKGNINRDVDRIIKFRDAYKFAQKNIVELKRDIDNINNLIKLSNKNHHKISHSKSNYFKKSQLDNEHIKQNNFEEDSLESNIATSERTPNYLPKIKTSKDRKNDSNAENLKSEIQIDESKIDINISSKSVEQKFLPYIRIPPQLDDQQRVFNIFSQSNEDQERQKKDIEYKGYKKKQAEYHQLQQQECEEYQNKIIKKHTLENEQRNRNIQKKIMKQSEQEKQAPEFVVIGFNIKLFRIAIEYGDFFTKTKIGREEVWISKNANISVHKDKITIRNFSDDDLIMMLDITLKKFGNSYMFTGSAEFIHRALMVMVHDPKFKNVVLSDPDQQEKFRILRNQIYMHSDATKAEVDKELFAEEMKAAKKIQPDESYFKYYEHKKTPNNTKPKNKKDQDIQNTPLVRRNKY